MRQHVQSLTTLPDFPAELTSFLRLNGVDPGEYRASSAALTSRFYRVNPFPPTGRALDAAALRTQMGGVAAIPVDWLPRGFFRVPHTTRLAGTDAFAAAQIYGMDASSAAAVYALDLHPGQDVLDLCCAPGAKLCLIADLLLRRGTLTGIDASRMRLEACVQIVKKYGSAFARLSAEETTVVAAVAGDDEVTAPLPPLTTEWRCRLIEADGAALDGGVDALADSRVVFDSLRLARLPAKFRKRRRKNKSWRARERREAKRMKLEAEEAATAAVAAAAQGEEDGGARAAAPPPPPTPTPVRYDRVLVDAECTHDGSLKHVAKLLQADDGGAALVARMLDETRLRELPALQRRLLRSGFGLLRPGGLLVYSTCSFARAQNEDVVAWLLACEPDAVEEAVAAPTATPYPASHGSIGVRFAPLRSGTSGLYIARIRKRAAGGARGAGDPPTIT
jgi:16S rRNA C967 or C1407 C5-methylase (RsmB/RsmF family)